MTNKDAQDVVIGRLQARGHVACEQRARRQDGGFAVDTHCTRCEDVVTLFVFSDTLGRACCGEMPAPCVARDPGPPLGVDDEVEVPLDDEAPAAAPDSPSEPPAEPQA